jgi:hypothetical protein
MIFARPLNAPDLGERRGISRFVYRPQAENHATVHQNENAREIPSVMGVKFRS